MLIALIVKSRRAASSSNERVNATSACLPSQFWSMRSVVISNDSFTTTNVTVPCLIPVGTTRRDEAAAIAIISSGVALVQRSKSCGILSSNKSRTAPPTSRRSKPTA